MRLLLVTCALVVGTIIPPAAAQTGHPFEGRLLEKETGTPVAGAWISIVGMNGSVHSDSDGRFAWSPAPKVPFQLLVVLASRHVARASVQTIAATGATPIQISPLADEVVTVLGWAGSIDAAPAAALAALPGANIARRNPENLMQALETLPGIAQVSEGHAAVPAIRGLARGRTLFLIDGARVTSERRVGPSATFLDPSVVENIDVARGPSSVAYGSDALGGVVSVRTRRAEPGSPLRTRVVGTVGAGVPEARGSVELSKGFARGGVLVQAHARNAEDYESPGGQVFNSGWSDQGLLVHVTHALAGGFLTAVWVSDYGRDLERPRNNSRVVRFSSPFENSQRFTASYQTPDTPGLGQLALTGFLGGDENRTDQDRFPTATAGGRIDRADVSARDFQLKASGQRALGPARLDYGVDLNGRHGLEAIDVIQTYDLSGALTAETSNVSIADARRINLGAYGQAAVPIGERMRVTGGVRADRVTTTNTAGFFGDQSTSNAAVSGFGAATIGLIEGLSVTAQISRGFRAPALSDRYFRGPSGRGFITGRPDLEPETSVQFDLATRYTRGRTQLAAYLYRYRLNDLIERYQTETDVFFFRNRGTARLHGVEVEARTILSHGYSVEIATQLARGRGSDAGTPLDDVSPDTLAVTGRKEIGDGRAYAQARLALRAEDPRPGPTEIATPGATLLDLGGGWRVWPALELRGLIRNLLGDRYYASPDPRWVEAPGRSVSLTSILQF